MINTPIDNFFLDAANSIAVDVTGGDMGENLQFIHLFCQFQHAEGSSDVAVDGIINPRIEVDAGSTVNDDVAALHQLCEILRGQPQTFLFQIAFTA